MSPSSPPVWTLERDGERTVLQLSGDWIVRGGGMLTFAELGRIRAAIGDF